MDETLETETPDTQAPGIDWEAFSRARMVLGADFIRILGYFREDGTKSLVAIEEAMRAKVAVSLILPAHTLKGEAAQFGANTLADLAEHIESVARHCVECRHEPDDLLEHVVRLRPLFHATMAAFDTEINPLVARRSGFGRKVEVANQGFGRI